MGCLFPEGDREEAYRLFVLYRLFVTGKLCFMQAVCFQNEETTKALLFVARVRRPWNFWAACFQKFDLVCIRICLSVFSHVCRAVHLKMVSQHPWSE